MQLIIMTAVVPPSLIVLHVLFGLGQKTVSPFKQPLPICVQELPLGHVRELIDPQCVA